MKKILITGGAGFIGSHLATRLLQQGAAVIALDDLSTGSRDNLADLEAISGFKFIEGTACDSGIVESLMRQVDEVYHLAASVGVRRIVGDLVASIKNTVQATEVVLEMAARHKRRVLLTSTSEVYGRSAGDRSFNENDDLRMGPTIKTRWSYACSKALDEYLAFAYYHERELPVTVVRLFNTVGERQSAAYGMVLPTFVKQALADQPLSVYGDGQQSRCFAHVSEVVKVLQALMNHPRAVGEVYNVGSEEEITIEALADRVISLLGSNSSKTFHKYADVYPEAFEDIDRRVPDVSKLKALLGFTPQLALNDIIRSVALAESEVATS